MEYTHRYKSHHDASRALKKYYTAQEMPQEYLEKKLASPAKEPLVLYLHVPFCNKICSFCPFHRPDELKRRSYHEYLIRQIEQLREIPFLQAPVSAVNFGGGTPTSLLPEQMKQVLETLHASFSIQEDAEISVESSATELTDEMLQVLTEGGVNRLSIGVQTFQDDTRKMFGRRGSGEHAAARVRRAMEYGIVNTNIDLIYHYPGQTEEMLQRDLEIIKELGIAGLSFYPLMIHEKTPLAGRLTQAQRSELADMAQEYALYEQIVEELSKAGFAFLELSKLVRDGLDAYRYMELRHNFGSCIALGEGAGGNIGEYFYQNTYKESLISERIPVSKRGRLVLPQYRMLDAFIYELQKCQADMEEYTEKLELPLEQKLLPALNRLEREELLVRQGSIIEFTQKGRFWGNNMIDEFIRLLLSE